MKNKYEVNGEMTTIFLKHKCDIYETMIDTEDFDKANAINGTWQLSANGYVRLNAKENGICKSVFLHKLFYDVPDGYVLDHINGNKLDNRKCNLRIATIGQNNQNRVHRQKNNTSGVRNVSWRKDENKWMVCIQVNGKTIHIGLFKHLDEAAEAARLARIKYHPYATI